MKNKPGRLFVFLLLSLLVVFSIVLSNCAYITGEAIEIIPTPTPVIVEITPTPTPVIKNITPEEANLKILSSSKWIDIIDVRTPQEYAAGHLDRAINIDFSSADFKENINKLDKNATYVVYCRTGARSAAASKVMAELGFTDIYNMTGGISVWEAAGLPVEK